MRILAFSTQLLLGVAALFLLSLFSSCEKTCVESGSTSETRTLTLDAFTGIYLEVDARVVLTEGPTQSVLVEGPTGLIDNLDTEVIDGVWFIVGRRCVNNSEPLTINITLPLLERVALNGVGEIQTSQPFSTVVDKLMLELNGAGAIRGVSEVREVDVHLQGMGTIEWGSGQPLERATVNITGGGDANLAGSSQTLSVDLEGLGDFDGRNFTAETATVSIARSGEAYVNALQTLDVTISGTGNVYYYGSPTLTQSITGSGEVIQQ